MSSTIYHGSVINPQTLSSYQALPNCLFAVSASGEIEWIVEDVHDSLVQETMLQKGCADDTNVVVLKNGEFLIPGFIDTHTHAPQMPNIGSGQQYELLDWLEKITFPMEAKFADVEFAKTMYRPVVRRFIDFGTTTCCYYGTIHLDATKALSDIIHDLGQRAFVGKCNMDRNSPSTYIEPSPECSVADTKTLITYIRSLDSTLVQPILTPRFAISCSSSLLAQLGSVAVADPTLRIQTHISENALEIAFTKSLFPECSSYADVYSKFGLLRHNTVLAHAVHLEQDEVELVKERNAGLSHCPTSNFNLSSGIARVGEWLDKGIKVGLGTDVSGGFSPSILTAIQHASIASKAIALQKAGTTLPPNTFADRQFSVATLLYLATLGGARVCDLESTVGSFAPGKSFDALIVNVGGEAGNPALWAPTEVKTEEALRGSLERFLFCGDDRNISRVYVQGRWIGGKSFSG